MQITEGFFIKIPLNSQIMITTGGKQPLHSAGRYTRLEPEAGGAADSVRTRIQLREMNEDDGREGRIVRT